MSIREFIKEDPTATQNALTSVGIGGFTAMARINESISYKSKTPTTHLEDDSFVHDHIINEPIQLSISGAIADVSITPVQAEAIIPDSIDKLERISAFYAPKFSNRVAKVRQEILAASKKRQQAKNILQQAQSLSLFGGVTNPTAKSIREQFVDAMEALHEGREIISIDMPYRTYKNMRITSLNISRNNKEEMLSFSLSASEIRMAEVEYTQIKKMIKKPLPGMESQTATLKDKGKQEGKKVKQEKESSLLRVGTDIVSGGK